MKQEELLDIALYVAKKMDKNTKLDLIMNLVPDKDKMKILEVLGFKIEKED